MFIDSSALVAMVASEVDGEQLAARLEEAYEPFTSPIVIFETVLALARIHRAPVAQTTFIVLEFLERTGIELADVHADTHLVALTAHERFGKGTGHRAQLNMGDCFSYAMAKKAGVPILYKGDDFAHTDLA